jgi:hypothetical protein
VSVVVAVQSSMVMVVVVDQRVKPLLAEKFTKMTKKSFYCNTFGLNDLQKHRDCSCDDAGTE